MISKGFMKCVCVCVCERERERQRTNKKKQNKTINNKKKLLESGVLKQA